MSGQGPEGPASLAASVVTFAPDLEVLRRALASLGVAIRRAVESGKLSGVSVWLVDNGPGDDWRDRLEFLMRECLKDLPTQRGEVISGHGNVGYGRAHNLAITRSSVDYHLIMNPDVIVDAEAIREALRFMQEHPQVGLLAPAVTGSDGATQYLCKRYPMVFDLLLRGFAPGFVKRLFAGHLARYEMRDVIGNDPVFDVPIASGAFIFCRGEVLRRVGGFSDAFFLYFEDFDLSMRLRRVAKIAYVPAVKIVHLGGYAARKGPEHVWMFAESAIKFFNRHGWKLW